MDEGVDSVNVATFPIEENLFHNEYLSTQTAFYCLTEGQSNRFV